MAKSFVSSLDLITSSHLNVPWFPFIPLPSLQSTLPSKGVFLELEDSAAGWALRPSEPPHLNHGFFPFTPSHSDHFLQLNMSYQLIDETHETRLSGSVTEDTHINKRGTIIFLVIKFIFLCKGETPITQIKFNFHILAFNSIYDC